MKAAVFLFISIFSTLCFASAKVVCTGENSLKESRRMVLTQVGSGVLRENVRHDFLLEVFKPNVRTPIIKEVVNVSHEDVVVSISNRAKKISGRLFMDEADGAWIKIGSEEITLVCPQVSM